MNVLVLMIYVTSTADLHKAKESRTITLCQLSEGIVMAVSNKAALLMYAVYLQVHPTTYNEELSLLTVHKRTNMAPK